MPPKKNSALRIVVPVLVGIVGMGVVFAVMVNTRTRPQTQPPQGQSPQAGQTQPGQGEGADPARSLSQAEEPSAVPEKGDQGGPGQEERGAERPTEQPAVAEGEGESSTVQAPPPSGLRPRLVSDETAPAPIGSTDPSSDAVFAMSFSPLNAGIERLTLTQYGNDYKPDSERVVLQREFRFGDLSYDPNTQIPTFQPGGTTTAFGSFTIEINGERVVLSGSKGRFWRETAPGAFEAIIEQDDGTPVLRLRRAYELVEGSYDFTLRQSAENLTDVLLEVVWTQYGSVDLPQEATGYGGDKRRVRFGYMGQGSNFVLSRDFLWSRDKVMGMGQGTPPPVVHPIWPNEQSQNRSYRVSWVGMSNRYFGLAIHPLDPAVDRQLDVQRVDRWRLQTDPAGVSERYDSIRLAQSVTLDPVAVAPGASADLSLGVFAGPLSRALIRSEDPSSAVLRPLGIDGLVVFSFGGPCAFCTFSPLTSALFSLLHFLHDSVLFDWGLAIIVLVLIVRTVLHPITKWSQIRIQKFGKQMQELAPKQKKIQEKYGSDKRRMQEEMQKLWREEGIDPSGLVGCFPMLLQTPIWIALFAMLYFAIELRHAPAFFGVFQNLSGGSWQFLADLAQPDRAIYFGQGNGINIPLLGTFMGEINAINILPLVLGFVFFIHQKYMTPQTTTTLSPEQEMQQKMMKVMMVVLFPLFMYNMPSGLVLYSITNSTIAIFESRYIRAHVKKLEEKNPDMFKKKRREPRAPGAKGKGGFMQRLQEAAEQRKAMMEEMRRTGKRPQMKGRPDMPGSGKAARMAAQQKPDKKRRTYKRKK